MNSVYVFYQLKNDKYKLQYNDSIVYVEKDKWNSFVAEKHGRKVSEGVSTAGGITVDRDDIGKIIYQSMKKNPDCPKCNKNEHVVRGMETWYCVACGSKFKEKEWIAGVWFDRKLKVHINPDLLEEIDDKEHDNFLDWKRDIESAGGELMDYPYA